MSLKKQKHWFPICAGRNQMQIDLYYRSAARATRTQGRVSDGADCFSLT
jgi:hypothetical protein